MKTRRTLTLSLAALSLSPLCALSEALAKVSLPQEVAARPSSHCQAPQWSPDGKRLAMEVYFPKKETRQVWIMNLSDRFQVIKEEQVGVLGQQTSRLADGKAPPVVEFTWTPDMEMLNPPYVFSTQNPQFKNFDIYGDGTWLTKNKGNDGQPSISSDANYLAFTSQQRDSGDIMMIDFGGDMEQPIALTQTPNFTEYHPQWHPKAPSLLFIRSQKSRGQDIMVIDDIKSPAQTTRALTEWAEDEIRPHWSPSGDAVAFYTNHESGSDKIFDLWVVGANGSGAKRLVKDVVVDEHKGPAWSKDGSTLFFVKRDFDRNNPIMWVNRSTGKSGVLTQETQINSDLSITYLSDDEMALAYRAAGLKTSEDKTWQRIYVLSFTMDDLR
jgi:Tol biopolymer transport system component